MSPEHLVMADRKYKKKKEKESKTKQKPHTDGDIAKGHRGQLKEIPMANAGTI